jgi:CheY-like chemotaxis protein
MKVLSLSLDLELSQLRKTVLNAGGHDVVVVTSEKDGLKAVASPASYDVVLICHHFPTAAARQVVRLLHHHHPDTRIVYIVHVYGEWPEVEADRYVVGADGSEALLRILAEVKEHPTGVPEFGTR